MLDMNLGATVLTGAQASTRLETALGQLFIISAACLQEKVNMIHSFQQHKHPAPMYHFDACITELHVGLTYYDCLLVGDTLS